MQYFNVHRKHMALLSFEEVQCNTLQHTATHCNTLQHTATYCSTLQLEVPISCCSVLLSDLLRRCRALLCVQIQGFFVQIQDSFA